MTKRLNCTSKASVYLFILSSIFISNTSNAAIIHIEPDSFIDGTNIEAAYAGVTLSVEGRPDAAVFTVDGYDVFNNRNIATSGSLVFGNTPVPSSVPSGKVWDETTFGLFRADFDYSTNYVQIDLIYDDDDIGGLWAYDSVGNLIESVTASGDGRGSVPFTTVSISRQTNDIAYILAGGVNAEALFLDNMQYNAVSAVPVPAAVWLFGSGLIGLIGLARRKNS